MTDVGGVRTRIETRITLGHFMANFMRVANDDSPRLQQTFSGHLLKVSEFLLKFLHINNLIVELPYRPARFWASCKGRAFGFVDGGVANVALPGVAPVGIRVGSYAVRPGLTGEEREDFKIEVAIIDDLYDRPGSLHDEHTFDDLAKLRDAARIVSEAAGCLGLIRRRADLDIAMMHGPLINPAAPYGTPGFPRYRLEAAQRLLGSGQIREDDDRHFVRLYRTILRSLEGTDCLVAGVIERDGGSQQVLAGYLDEMLEQKIIGSSEKNEIEGLLSRYGLSDTQLFDLVLSPGQYLSPVCMSRQGESRKWPQGPNGSWYTTIENYPRALVTFLKPSERSQPFRVEMFEHCKRPSEILDLVFHTSRLLPNYGFPAALDIVDKFARIPNWMSANISTQHKVNLLRRAYDSDDLRVREFARKMLTATGRDWLFRPKA